MKNILFVLGIVFLASNIFAQAPNKMSYQTVIRNSSNALVTSQSVGIQVSVLQTSATGTAVYVERHFPTTNANGLASFEIGTGTVVSGTFAGINWASGTYFVKTQVDPNGGSNYTITGTSQLLSVPFALESKHATTANSATTATTATTSSDNKWTSSGSNIYNNNSGNIGLGTSSIIEKITTGGNIAIRTAGSGLRGYFGIGTTNSTYANSWAGIGSYNTGGDDQADLRFYTSYGSRGERMIINRIGAVGIATGSPSYTLEVNGTAGKPGGGSWTAASDARLKDNVLPYQDGLQSILAINPVKFHYNEKSGIDTNKEYIGVLAQDLKEVAPYMVGSFDKDGETYLDVDNSAMTYMLINAVKEQQKQIEELKQRITELEGK